jgi:hypothetical protein
MPDKKIPSASAHIKSMPVNQANECRLSDSALILIGESFFGLIKQSNRKA